MFFLYEPRFMRGFLFVFRNDDWLSRWIFSIWWTRCGYKLDIVFPHNHVVIPENTNYRKSLSSLLNIQHNCIGEFTAGGATDVFYGDINFITRYKNKVVDSMQLKCRHSVQVHWLHRSCLYYLRYTAGIRLSGWTVWYQLVFPYSYMCLQLVKWSGWKRR